MLHFVSQERLDLDFVVSEDLRTWIIEVSNFPTSRLDVIPDFKMIDTKSGELFLALLFKTV